MKRIITLTAIAMAMALPSLASAQTPDYYGYGDAEKTILIQWAKEAIDNNNITFTTTTAKTNFLNLCNDLEAYASQSDWSSCVTVSTNLKTAAGYINGADIKALVEDCCDATAAAFDASEDLCMSSSDHDEIGIELNNGNLLGGRITIYFKHFKADEDCQTEKRPDGSNKHISKCMCRLEVYY